MAPVAPGRALVSGSPMLPFISVSEAIGRPGLRLVLSAGRPGVSPSVPGPWGQSAKALFDIKGVPYIPVAQIRAIKDDALRHWTGQDSAPVAMYENERPRTRWYEILQLAERLAPEPRLLPGDESVRAEMMGLAHSLLGEDGLAWNVRLILLKSQEHLTDEASLIWRARYGDATRSADDAAARVRNILQHLSAKFRENAALGGDHLVGDRLTALDIFWACTSTLVAPFPEAYCPMPDFYRKFSERVGRLVGEALDPALIEHRERIIADHFPLPMQF